MASRHRRTYDAIFANPVRANISWNDAVSVLEAFGAIVTGAGGSRFAVDLNGRTVTFHRPHPGNEIPRPLVRAIRAFLNQAGVNPDDL